MDNRLEAALNELEKQFDEDTLADLHAVGFLEESDAIADLLAVWKEMKKAPPELVKVAVKGGVAEVTVRPDWIWVSVDDQDGG